jgi:hypothetical protein
MMAAHANLGFELSVLLVHEQRVLMPLLSYLNKKERKRVL